jgi:DNA repair exonuclease SbcCD ATPase subunit
MTEALENVAKIIDRSKERYSTLKSHYTESKYRLKELYSKYETVVEARGIAQSVASSIQSSCFDQFAAVVSKCLSTALGSRYQLKLNYTQKAGKTQVELLLMDGEEEYDPMSDTGGGVVDIVSFALRIAAMVMKRPESRSLFILDEPFRFLSQEYRESAEQLVQELATELNCQFVIVTHINELISGTVINID